MVPLESVNVGFPHHMRVFLQVVITAVGIAFCVLALAYSYRRFGRIPPPPVPKTSESTRAPEEAPNGKSCSPERFHKTLAKRERQQMLEGEFRLVTSTELLPMQVKEAFTEVTCLRRFALANPGEKYQVTGVVVEPGLPFRRMILAGVSGNRWLIHYEHGGIGHSTAVILFDMDSDGKVRFVWGGSGSESVKSVSALRSAIGAGRFSDGGIFYW
jgi:hypothetical protein